MGTISSKRQLSKIYVPPNGGVRAVWAIIIILCLFSATIVVESMVVTTSPKPISTGAASSSDSVIRKLLQGQKDRRRKKAKSSYTIDTPVVNGDDEISQNSATIPRRTSPLLDEWRDYEALRDTNLEDEALQPFFFESGWERKQIIAQRFGKVIGTLYTAQKDWNESQAQIAATKLETGVDDDDDGKEVSLKAPNKDDPAAIRLCEAVASLGPLAVKLGQTLSQRPDIVGRDACDALKRLQTQNVPFDDALAYAILRESLDYWEGPLAANSADQDGTRPEDKDMKPLFQSLSKEPIASASLGQVYKATTFDGVDIALKVQRPDALSILAIDTQCFRIASAARNTLIDWTEQTNAILGKINKSAEEHTPETGMTEDEVRSLGEDGTVASVINRVAKDIKREMDYRVEAENSYKFRESLEFLGFVDTPDVLLATDKILATKFVNGHHLSSLETPQQELALTRMAVEACTASMVLTGFVHADPHEGNLMLRTDDGRIVFLDFGLMSDIDSNIMEAFAQGIQALLSEDFPSMTEAFSDTGFITTPIMHRESMDDLWKVDPDFGFDELAADLELHMKTTEGGMSRFGALATVLNKKISPNWLVFTPPYVLLLIRTFLTLEGIAAQVDPDFNIYEMSLPWVVRRSLSPSTKKGMKVLRSTILKPDNKIQWERIMELMEMQKAASEASNEESSSPSPSAVIPAETTDSAAKTPSFAAATTDEEREQKRERFAAAQQGAMKDAVGTLLGSTNGKALRSVLRDLDTPDLIWKLGSAEGRPILKMGTEKALNNLFSSKSKSNSDETASSSTIPAAADQENYRPVSEECRALRDRQARRTKQITSWLLRSHIKRCLLHLKGIVGIARLGVSTLQIAFSILLKKAFRKLLKARPNQRQTSQTATAAVV